MQYEKAKTQQEHAADIQEEESKEKEIEQRQESHKTTFDSILAPVDSTTAVQCRGTQIELCSAIVDWGLCSGHAIVD